MQEAFSKLTGELESGPFHVKIVDQTKQFTPRITTEGAWKVSGIGPTARKPNQFFVQGVMQDEDEKPEKKEEEKAK